MVILGSYQQQHKICQAPPSRKIGINLTRPTYFDKSITYADALRQTQMLTGFDYTGQQEVPVDSNGRPTVDIPTAVSGLSFISVTPINSDQAPMLSGLQFYLELTGGASKVKINGIDYTSSQFIDITGIPEETNILVKEAVVGTDWHLWRPGETVGQKFHSYYLNSLQGFSCLRGMDWVQTNDSPHVDWTDRRLPTDMGQSSSFGASWEDLIELTNIINTDLWINIPHGASDDYIEQLATLMSNELNPGINLYVEFSNECWNSALGFKDQYNHIANVGNTQFPGEPNDLKRWARGYGYECNRTYTIFKSIYGEANYVCAWQAVASFTKDYAIQDCVDIVTHIALAPYIYLPSANPYYQLDEDLDVTIQRIYDEGLPTAEANMINYKGFADEYNKVLIAYECGAHTTGTDTDKAPLIPVETQEEYAYALARHPEMFNIYKQYDDIWERIVGNTLRCYFNYEGSPRNGNSFGAKDFAGDDQHPKWLALRWLIEN